MSRLQTTVRAFAVLDRRLGRLGRAQILALAVCGVLVVGGIDYLTGYEVSVSLFYLGPVALASWYAGRRAGVAIAVLSCASWYLADVAAGHPYSHPAIPIWDSLVRFGFFLITGLLVAALRKSLLVQRHLARTDALTGLYGRRAFEEKLKDNLALAQRRKSALTLAYVDLDHFKALNDTHGHAEGDRALQAIGQALKGAVREADTAARLGGDEFGLILPDTEAQGARHVIWKIRRELQDALDAGHWGITCSIGVVTILDAAMSAERVIGVADAVMYGVKHQGKGAVAFRVFGEPVQPRTEADAPEAARR